MQGNPLRLAAFAAGVSALLAACGGDSSSAPTPPPPPPPPPAPLTVTGKAATGAAMSGAAISATCATGTGTAIAAADGSYSLDVTAGQLPCVLEATGADVGGATITLHSVATGTTAQITPLTELLIAQVTGAEPVALMTSGNIAGLSSTFSASNVQAAQALVLTMLSDAGIDTSSLASGDLFTGTLAAGSGTGYDGVLDALGQALVVSGTTLGALTDTVVAQSGGGGGGTPAPDSTTSVLSSELLLRAASPTCTTLRSGSYWMITSASNDGKALQHITVDAAAGTFTDQGDIYTLTPHGTCRYTITTPNGDADLVVAPSGVLVARTISDNSGNFVLSVAVPQQTHALADFAGDWNRIGSDTDDAGTGWVFGYGHATVAVSGSGATVQVQKACTFQNNVATPDCVENSSGSPMPVRTLTLDTDGGAVEHSAVGESGPWADKYFAYRAGNGQWFEISANISTPGTTGDGSIGFGTRAQPLALPEVGSTSTNWNVYMNMATQVSTVAIDANTHTIDSVDATAGTFARTTGNVGAATHSETLAINNPIDGMQFRDGATGVATSDGNTTNVRRTYYLKVPGTGVSVLLQSYQAGITNTPRIVMSVNQPAP